MAEKKKHASPHDIAVANGSLGGKVGGRRRAEVLSAEEKHEIAKKAAQARWSKERRKQNTPKQKKHNKDGTKGNK